MGQQGPTLGNGAAAHYGEVPDRADGLIGLGLGTAMAVEGVLQNRRCNAPLGEAGRQLDTGGVAVIVPRRHQHTHTVGRLLGNDLADVGGRGIGR